jgi:outer membrane receptor protein involved in Fe transport
MRKLAAIVLGMLLPMIILAQQTGMEKGNGKITGKVIESVKNTPLEYATIIVLDKVSGKTITGATTDNTGQFIVTAVNAGSYKILVEFIGYKSYEIPSLDIKKNATVDLKTITLTRNQQSMAEVTVTGQAKLIENKIDKMVFNAEKDLTAQGGVATDLLKKVPQVSVDVDGNVQLAGSSGIRFLINGKPSTAFGNNAAEVLQSIPASQIKSIEVITNPGARYDAQGLGGIINIILKQTTVKGINGNLSLTAGTRNENGSFNFNARNKNVGFNAFVSGNARLAVNTPFSSQRNSTDTSSKTIGSLLQNGKTGLKRHGLESGMGFDWTYKKYNNFTASVRYDLFGNSNYGLVNQLQTTADYSGNPLTSIASINNTDNTNRSHNIDAAFNYKRTFNREDQELEFSVNTSMGRSTALSNNEQRLLPADSIYYGVQNRNPGKENETQIALDYTQPLSEKIIVGTGVKTTFLDISSNSAVQSYDPGNKQYNNDNSLSNSLTYHQKVYAAYAEITFPVAQLFDVKMGSRYERTEINANYSNAQQGVKSPGYHTFVPSIFFSKKLSHDQQIRLSYSKRIERPDYGDLNPFINTSDPKNITAGNPFLLPELGQRVEFTYSKDLNHLGSFTVTAFYRHNSQDIQPYVKFYPSLTVGDSVYYNVSVSSRENIGTENNTGVNLFSDLHITSKLGVRTNIFMFHRKIINAIDVGNSRTSFNYRISLNATYQFTPLLAAEFFGNFNSARNEVQGKYPSLTTYSFAFRKQFWNKKASLALMAINPFNEYVKQRLELYGTDFKTTSVRKIPFRSVGINFTWKFGLLEFKKEEDNKEMDNLTP